MSQCAESVLLSIYQLLSNLSPTNYSLVLSLLEHHLDLHSEDINCAITEIINETE